MVTSDSVKLMEDLVSNEEPHLQDDSVIEVRSVTERLVSVVGHNVPGPRWRAYREAIAGLRYYREYKKNLTTIDQLPTLLSELRKAEFHVDVESSVLDRLQAFTAEQWSERKAAEDRIMRIDEEIFKATKGDRLFSYQKTGAMFLVRRRRALLADDQGTGKTRQVLVAIPAGAPVLVIGPVVAKGTWEGEVRVRPQIQPTVLYGRGSFRWPRAGEMVVTNFAILPEVHDLAKPLAKHQTCRGREPAKPCPGCKKALVMSASLIDYQIVPGEHVKKCKGLVWPPPCLGCLAKLLDGAPEGCVVVIDEAHNGKNPQSEQTVRMRALVRAALNKNGRVWLLTGTPMENNPLELWNVLEMGEMAHEAFDDMKTFKRLFDARPNESGFGLDWSLPKEEVVERLQRVSLRRMKEDVMKDLPPKLYQSSLVRIDKETMKICDKLADALGVERIGELVTNEAKSTVGEFSRVRAALATAKIPAMLEIVEEHEKSKEPLIVFSAHRRPIDILAGRKGWVVVTGAEDSVEKKRAAAVFQAGKKEDGTPVVGIALTIQAGGVSLTLTRARKVMFVDRHPNPAKNLQAEDRAHRLTQFRGVIILDLTAKHPVDERINEILIRKTRMISATVDSTSVKDDAPLPEPIQLLLKAAETEVLEDSSRTDAELHKETYDALHSRSWESRATHKLAVDLAEEATSVGLTDGQWRLAEALLREAKVDEPKTTDDKEESETDMATNKSSKVASVRKLEHTVTSLLSHVDGLKDTDRQKLLLGTLKKMEVDARGDFIEELMETYCSFGEEIPCECDHDSDDEDDDEEDDEQEDGEYDDEDEDEKEEEASE